MAISDWERFKIGSKPPNEAKSTEMLLFSAVQSACARTSLDPITEINRAQQLLKSISLRVRVQERDVSVYGLIQDEITKAKLGKAAVTRDYVFQQYSHFYEFRSHQIGCSRLDNANQSVLPLSVDGMDKTLQCRDCSGSFVFSVKEQQFYESKNLTHNPARCPDCTKKHKAGMASKVCQHFQRGNCSYGKRCRMMHSVLGDNSPSGSNQGPKSEKLTIIKCRDCDKKFEEENRAWTEKGLMMPKTCVSCRGKKKGIDAPVCLVDPSRPRAPVIREATSDDY